MSRSFQVLIRMMVMLALITVTGFAHSGSHAQISSMRTFPVFDADGNMTMAPKLIPHAWASLETSSRGAEMAIYARMLEPGDAVTSWWVIFNHPENCTDNMCGEDDVFEYPELASVSLVGGMGTVVGYDGKAEFFNFLHKGYTYDAVFGPGLTNPKGAEIHFVLRSHGKADGEIVGEQLGSMNGGCDPYPPHAPCKDVQFAVFRQ